MEEMRRVAMAYYANMSNDQQQMVLGFYKSIDTNGDEKVSVQEYLDFLKQKDYNRFVPPNLFKLLDKNNDGTLDFEECVTFFYMVTAKRFVICDGCGSYLWGVHFLCVECHSAGGTTFDLCFTCYGNKNFSHAHSTFLDNYALLRTKPPKGNTTAGVGRRGSRRNQAAEAFQTAARVADTANSAYDLGSNIASVADCCTIM